MFLSTIILVTDIVQDIIMVYVDPCILHFEMSAHELKEYLFQREALLLFHNEFSPEKKNDITSVAVDYFNLKDSTKPAKERQC